MDRDQRGMRLADEIKLVELEDGWVTYVKDAEGTRLLRRREMLGVVGILGATAAVAAAGAGIASALGPDPILGALIGSLVGVLVGGAVATTNSPVGWRISASHRGLGLRKVFGKNAGSVQSLREDRPSKPTPLQGPTGERLIPWVDVEQVRGTDISVVLHLVDGEHIELACEQYARADIARLAQTLSEIQARYADKAAPEAETEQARKDLARLKQSQTAREL